jgi:hypothetical protein
LPRRAVGVEQHVPAGDRPAVDHVGVHLPGGLVDQVAADDEVVARGVLGQGVSDAVGHGEGRVAADREPARYLTGAGGFAPEDQLVVVQRRPQRRGEQGAILQRLEAGDEGRGASAAQGPNVPLLQAEPVRGCHTMLPLRE